jgi:hypothetical protein
MSHALSCATPLVYWRYSIEDQGPHTLLGIVGVLAFIPGCPRHIGRMNAANEWAQPPLVVGVMKL